MATPCEQIGVISALHEKVVSLERWEQTQNGSLSRIEQKMDGLTSRLEDKVENLRNWLLGALLSAALCLLVEVFRSMRPH